MTKQNLTDLCTDMQCTSHNRPSDQCDQCKIENYSDEELLQVAEDHAKSMRDNNIVPRGWWIELAKRLRREMELAKLNGDKPVFCWGREDD
jgi:hypothetical protein